MSLITCQLLLELLLNVFALSEAAIYLASMTGYTMSCSIALGSVSHLIITESPLGQPAHQEDMMPAREGRNLDSM